jgi:hypothetical protein
MFYLTYSIYETTSHNFVLSWLHCFKLMHIKSKQKQNFYEIECIDSQKLESIEGQASLIFKPVAWIPAIPAI